MDFAAMTACKRQELERYAVSAVDLARSLGADECEVSLGYKQGIEVGTRKSEIETVEFNQDILLEVTVYRDHRTGRASTTDMSREAISRTVEAALSLSSFTDQDEYAGLAEPELLYRGDLDLKLCHEPMLDTRYAAEKAGLLERMALERHAPGIRGSDGASFESGFNIGVVANSHDFVYSSLSSNSYLGLCLLGEQDGRLQRGRGFDVRRDYHKLNPAEEIVDEAVRETQAKLGAVQVKTAPYNVIFSRGAARSLISHLLQAISGGAIYRRSSYLCGALNTRVLPDFLTLKEEPHLTGGLASACCDADGVGTYAQEIVTHGVLNEYLLGTYSARRLGMTTNGHAGGTHNLELVCDEAHSGTLSDLMLRCGSGIVVTDLMGQGVDIASGNYSRGASGF